MINHTLVQAKLGQHYAMMPLKLNKLSKSSPTRHRLEVARELFEEGWKVLFLTFYKILPTLMYICMHNLNVYLHARWL